jgi:hypothetical protein
MAKWTGPSLSPSRAKDFELCPLKYKFAVIDKIYFPPTIEAFRGTFVHQILEDMFKMPREQRTIETAKGHKTLAWDKVLNSNDQYPLIPEVIEMQKDPQKRAEFDERVDQLLENYFALENPALFTPTALEKWVQTFIDVPIEVVENTKPSSSLSVTDVKQSSADLSNSQEAQKNSAVSNVGQTTALAPTHPDFERAKEAARLSGNHIGIARHLFNSEEQMQDRKNNALIALSINSAADAVFKAQEIVEKAKSYAEQRVSATENADSKQLQKRAQNDYIDLTLQAILTIYRDISLIIVGGDPNLIINQFCAEQLRQYARVLTLKEIKMRIDAIEEARTKLLANALVPLTLEALFASLLIPKRAFA